MLGARLLSLIHFAHVDEEAIVPKHDDAAGEAWLHGRFRYMLYRRPQESR